MSTSSTRQSRQRHSEFGRNAENHNPVSQASTANSASLVLSPSGKGFGFSEGCENPTAAAVSGLYLPIHKCAVLRAVVAVVVDSLKCEARSVTVAIGPFLKSSEVLPRFTHADTTGSVESEAPVFGSRASVSHLLPDTVQRVVAEPVFSGHGHLRVTSGFSKGEAGLGVAGVRAGHDSRGLSPVAVYAPCS